MIGAKRFPTRVSIHAPREGCDFILVSLLTILLAFQFTHPGRGATTPSPTLVSSSPSFNSRTPGGVRLQQWDLQHIKPLVSIHAPREGCDLPLTPRSLSYKSFNSRTLGRVRPPLVHSSTCRLFSFNSRTLGRERLYACHT